MDEDVDGMQSTIYVLQQQLKEAKDQIAALQQDNELLRQPTESKGGARTLVPEGSSKAANAVEGMDTEPTQSWTEITDSLEPGKPPPTQGSSVGSTPDSTSSGTDNRTNCQMHDSSSHDPHSYHHSQPQTQTGKRPATTNGDHHVAMETDTSEGHPESCDETTAEHRQHNQAKQTSTVHNNATHRTSQSSEGAYTLEGTDVSSDAWSPAQTGGTKLGGNAVTDDQIGLVSDPYRTEEKHAGGLPVCGDRDSLQNGLVNSQYDSQGDDDDT